MAKVICAYCLKIFKLKGPGVANRHNQQPCCCMKCHMALHMFEETFNNQNISDGTTQTDLKLWLEDQD